MPHSINLGGVLRQLPKVQLVHQRASGGSTRTGYQHGEFVDVGTFSATVQPADAATIQNLPDGEHAGEAILIHTAYDLGLSDESMGEVSHRVTYKGRQWKVVEKGDWTQHGFYRYVAARVKQR